MAGRFSLADSACTEGGGAHEGPRVRKRGGDKCMHAIDRRAAVSVARPWAGGAGTHQALDGNAHDGKADEHDQKPHPGQLGQRLLLLLSCRQAHGPHHGWRCEDGRLGLDAGQLLERGYFVEVWDGLLLLLVRALH